jgi:hypothetical protein
MEAHLTSKVARIYVDQFNRRGPTGNLSNSWQPETGCLIKAHTDAIVNEQAGYL